MEKSDDRPQVEPLAAKTIDGLADLLDLFRKDIPFIFRLRFKLGPGFYRRLSRRAHLFQFFSILGAHHETIERATRLFLRRRALR